MNIRKLIVPKICRFKITDNQYLLDYPRTNFLDKTAKNYITSSSSQIKELITQTPLNAVFDKLVHLNGPCLTMGRGVRDGVGVNDDDFIIHERSFRKVVYRHDGFPIVTNSPVTISILINKNGYNVVSAKIQDNDGSHMIEFQIENDDGWEIIFDM